MQLDLIRALQSIRTPGLTLFFELVTTLGASQVFVLLVPFIFWCFSTRHGFRFMLAVLVSIYINSMAKELGPLFISDQGWLYTVRPYRQYAEQVWTCRSDPAFDTAGRLAALCIEEETLAFPSGHSQTSLVALGYASVILRRRWLTVLSIMCIILIGVSRVYLGQHWPTDVLGGWLIGAVLLAAVLRRTRASNHRPRLLNRVLVALTLVTVPVLVALDPDPTFNRARVLGLLAGMSIGYALHLRYAPFPVRAPWPVQIGKIVIGLLGIVLVQIGLDGLLPDMHVVEFVLAVLTGLWALFGAPLIFGMIWSKPMRELESLSRVQH